MVTALLNASAFTLGLIIGISAGGLVGLILGIFLRAIPREEPDAIQRHHARLLAEHLSRGTPGGDQVTDPVP